ncbi:MAG: hypothetical protein V2I27_00770 [Erythrobacter sp.]|nr:hypothetical protein [Erythrobacter sp.]
MDRNFGAPSGNGGLGDPLESPGGALSEAGRGETIQRLQIGVTTLAVMLTMIALASILGTQAKLAEEAAVPDAAPTTEPTAAPAQRDPLADAGVVPDIPTDDEPAEPEEGGERRLIVPDTPPPGAVGGQNPGAAPKPRPENGARR